jgi:hypothetical protein
VDAFEIHARHGVGRRPVGNADVSDRRGEFGQVSGRPSADRFPVVDQAPDDDGPSTADVAEANPSGVMASAFTLAGGFTGIRCSWRRSIAAVTPCARKSSAASST